mgnify:CR=1 FL=1
MPKKPVTQKRISADARPRQDQVRRYTQWFVVRQFVGLAFHITILYLLIGGVSFVLSVVRPPVIIDDSWFFILCLVIVVPLYYIRKKVDQRFREIKEQLER